MSELDPSCLAVYRPSNGNFYLADGRIIQCDPEPGGQFRIPVPAHFDDVKALTPAVYRRPNGMWCLDREANRLITFGAASHIPLPGNYLGRGLADLAVFDPATMFWHIAGKDPIPHGTHGDIPVPADYNGDGKIEIAIWRPSDGSWHIRYDDGHTEVPQPYWGKPGDIPLPGDYLGTGRAQRAVFRPENGTWYIEGREPVPFGNPAIDFPIPYPYRAEGHLDIAVYRSTDGGLYVEGAARPMFFGTHGDLPVPGRYRWFDQRNAALHNLLNDSTINTIAETREPRERNHFYPRSYPADVIRAAGDAVASVIHAVTELVREIRLLIEAAQGREPAEAPGEPVRGESRNGTSGGWPGTLVDPRRDDWAVA